MVTGGQEGTAMLVFSRELAWGTMSSCRRLGLAGSINLIINQQNYHSVLGETELIIYKLDMTSGCDCQIVRDRTILMQILNKKIPFNFFPA